MGKEMEVALAVKSWLAAQGLKLNDVAERLGVSAQAVSSQLSGDRTFGRRNAERYAEVFGFNANYLITGEGSLLAENHEHVKAEGDVSRLIRIIESQQETIAVLAQKVPGKE